MVDASDPAALPNGTIIDGRYRLARRLGRGGFAWVYEAEHTDLGRAAAVKLLDPPRGEAAAQFAERFMREARIVARLSHPNVVTVYDFGVHEPTGQPYLAMELLRGHDLEHELTTFGPLDPQRAKALFMGGGEALRVAHAAGVVHKDLKPSNLFIADPNTPSERMVLLDFGIAWAFDEESRITKIGGFTGTPAYVAPEYARHLEVSPAVDVYQMGLILSEALSGIPCVQGQSSVQLILAHCSGEVILSGDVLASEFGPVVQKATAFEAADRYREGGEFAAALGDVDATTLERAEGMLRPGEVVTAQLLFESVDESDADALVPTRKMKAIDRTETIDKPREAPTEVHAPEPLGWPWYLAGVLTAVLVVALVINRMQAREHVADTPTAEVTAPATELDDIAAPIEAVEEAPVEELTETVALKPRFTVSTTPLGAVVYRGDERLGRTPVVLRGDVVDGSEAELRIELDGHKSHVETVGLTNGGRLDVELESTAKPVSKAMQDQNFRPGNVFDMIEFSRKINEEHGAGRTGVVTPHELILQQQKSQKQ